MNAVRSGVKHETLLAWKREPAQNALQRLSEQAAALSERLGKGPVAIEVDCDDTRLVTSRWTALWSSLVHVVRNSIDHGFTPEHSAESTPSLWFTTATINEELRIEIRDNGVGIQWDKPREKALAARRSAETQEELISLLFADGISTRDDVSGTSGRGVGMAAVRAVTEELNGRIEVHSERGQGTQFLFWLPLEQQRLAA